MSVRLFVSGGCVAGCALLLACGRPGAPRSLAERVAPQPVWDVTEPPLASLLRAPRGPVVISVGDENLRCELRPEPGEVWLDCGVVAQGAPSFDALLRAVNEGELHRALARRRLSNAELFREATQIKLEVPWGPEVELSGRATLAEPFGEGQFFLEPHGEVRVVLGDEAHPLEFRARSVWGLGRELREGVDEVREARAVVRVTEALAPLLAPLRLPPAAGYGTQTLGGHGVKPADDERIKQRLAHAVLFGVDVMVERSGVVRLERKVIFDEPFPQLAECERLGPWLTARIPAIAREQPERGCDWTLTGGGIELRLSLTSRWLYLSYALSMGRRLELP